MKKPLLSVITVVFNNVKHIERTIKSVAQQTYPNIEYLIIDGKSTDGTLAIIEKYKENIDIVLSEPDKGIYDAMNKGLKLAKGDYILFMNSGDEIYDKNTVATIFKDQAFADIYYGETEMIDEDLINQGQRRHKAPERLDLNSFRFGMSVSHQAIYIKKSITKFYDPQYQLSADIDWILDAISKAKTIMNTKMYVAKYLIGGMSKKRQRQSLLERYQIFKKYYGFFPNLFNHVIIAFKLAFYYLKKGKTND
ncbi:glycosyltransferase [Pedobacter sp. SD-b]|uniref:Glycosyltransferase n=1 Tax=Pedobacter segetis TaxID=2793069 RepID=A0ABS1BH98_9SPHI|nr:glycosyltransferase family 2 protein [Pedobacter segetis]MBK0382250.1 glycosyltransferase [Pedobacter segetis]